MRQQTSFAISFGCLVVFSLVFRFPIPVHAFPQTDFRTSAVFTRGSDITFSGATSASSASSGSSLGQGQGVRFQSGISFPVSSSFGFGGTNKVPKVPIPSPTPAAALPNQPLPSDEDTNQQGNGTKLSRLCPQTTGPTDEFLMRYDASTWKCGTIGLREHCPENMIFYSFPESKIYGQCDCIYETGNGKPFVYNVQENKCFQVFEQGHCASGQWIAPSQGGNPVCTNSRCQNIFAGAQRQNASDFVLYNAECVRLNQPFRDCQQDEVIGFFDGELEPKCKPKINIGIKGVGSVKSLKCAPGTFLSITGKCQQGFSWDWK